MFQKSEMLESNGQAKHMNVKATGPNFHEGQKLVSHFSVSYLYTSHHRPSLTTSYLLPFAEVQVGAAGVASRSELNHKFIPTAGGAIIFSDILNRLQPAPWSDGA